MQRDARQFDFDRLRKTTRKGMKAFSLTLSLLVLLMPEARTASEDARLYATVLEVGGTAIVGDKRLKKGTKLYAEQTIECRLSSGICLIRVQRCEVRDDPIKIEGGKHFRIPAVDCRIVRQEFERFRNGGRNEEPERSSGNIISPNSRQAFAAHCLIFRWQPFLSSDLISLSIESPGGDVLWSESVSGSGFAIAKTTLRKRSTGRLLQDFRQGPQSG